MPVITEVAEGLKLLGDVVKSTREIVKAINDGRAYLKRYHPEAEKDLSGVLAQMERAVEGLASVTAVVSSFRFVVAGDSADRLAAERDLRDLRKYLMKQSQDIATLQGRIRALKADCDKVRILRDKLDGRSKKRSWVALLGLADKMAARSQALYSSLSTFFADDQMMIQSLSQLLKLAQDAVDEVTASLGPAATMNPDNVPLAATILGAYAELFQKPTRELQDLANQLNETRIALGG